MFTAVLEEGKEEKKGVLEEEERGRERKREGGGEIEREKERGRCLTLQVQCFPLERT